MKSNIKFFKNCKTLPVDKFFEAVLYDKKFGYYNSKNPFGKEGDFITAPKISRLFSEMIALWIISTWEIFGKPKKINIIELGPGDGSLMKDLVEVFKKFSEFNKSKKIYLYEKSNSLKKVQKSQIHNLDAKWIDNFSSIKKGPVIFFGNEFVDAIPIKQFKKKNKTFMEKNYLLVKKNEIREVYKNAKKKDVEFIKSFKILKNQNFIEFPKNALTELKDISKKICELNGCIMIIDYGYFKPNNKNTLQSVFKHKKNNLMNHLGKADITSHVNFSLLSEFFLKRKLKVKKIVSQKKFLENMGILKRAEILAKNMKFRNQSDLYLRLRRLLSPKLMGDLFKVILAYKFKSSNYFGFD